MDSTLFKLEEFIPYYMTADQTDEIYGKGISFEDSIYLKKEFNELKLEGGEEKPSEPGILLKNQKFLSRFMSPRTMNDEILAYHSIGTGKTCLAIGIAEEAKKINPKFIQTLVVVKNESIRNNFIRELVFQCTVDKYIPKNYEQLSDKQQVLRINRLVNRNYEFLSFYGLAKDIYYKTNEQIIRDYSNRVIIIDEAHNLKLYKERDLEEGPLVRKGKKFGSREHIDVYNNIFKMLHLIENRKIVLLTATPMRDRPEEFATTMNLILPIDKQIPTAVRFINTFFDKDSKMKNEHTLSEYIRGRVSYLKSAKSNLVKQYMGSPQKEYGIDHFILVKTEMSIFQSERYKDAFVLDMEKEGNIIKNIEGLEQMEEKIETIEQGLLNLVIGEKPSENNKVMQNGNNIRVSDDKAEKELTDIIREKARRKNGLYNSSRQASLFVYPDGTYGTDGFKKNIIVSNNRHSLSRDLRRHFIGPPLIMGGTMARIKDCSIKFYNVFTNLRNYPKENAFVYSKLVSGSGTIIFSLLLELLGFHKWKPGDQPNPSIRRYVSITAATMSSHYLTSVLDSFNHPRNKYGDVLQIIVGSHLIGEGINLKNVRQIHILTPHWNNSETEQAIGRGIRNFSHDDLPVNERYVKIFKYMSVVNASLNQRYEAKGVVSIDAYMYKTSEDKDYMIKQIEHCAKVSSVDCILNKSQNYNTMDKDYSRDCEYGLCKYECNFIHLDNDLKHHQLITDTYNLYYAEEEIEVIIEIIKKMFQHKSYYNVFELRTLFSDNSIIIILRALKVAIDRSIKIVNKFGIVSYLREYKNLYFLVDDIKLPNEYYFSYYTENPSLHLDTKFSEMAKMAQISSMDDILLTLNKVATSTDLSEEEKVENVRYILTNLDYEIQEIFLEKALMNPRKELNKLITTVMKAYISDADGNIVQSGGTISKLPEKYGKPYRCLIKNEISSLGSRKEMGEWVDCTEKIIQDIKSAKDRKIAELEDPMKNKYGLYGISDNKDFKVKFLVDKNKDNRKNLRGIVCKNIIPVIKIIDQILFLRIPILKKDKISRETAVHNLVKEIINKVGGNNLPYKDKDLREFSKILLEGKNVDANLKKYLEGKDVFSLYMIFKSQKEELCNLLESWLKVKGLYVTTLSK